MIAYRRLGVLTIQWALLSAWMVDDAGITLSYARSIAHGLGPIPQVAATPVEGYSSPLWIFIVAPLTWLPEPFLAAKALALAVTALALGRGGDDRHQIGLFSIRSAPIRALVRRGCQCCSAAAGLNRPCRAGAACAQSA